MKKVIYFNKNNGFGNVIINILKKHFGSIIEFITEIPLDPKIKIDIFVLDEQWDLDEHYDFEAVQANKKMMYQSSSKGYNVVSEIGLSNTVIEHDVDDFGNIYDRVIYPPECIGSGSDLNMEEHIRSIVLGIARFI